MSLINDCIKKLQKTNNKIKIAFVEGHSKRMIKAAKEILSENIAKPVMIFETNNQFEKVKDSLENLETFIIDQNQDKIVSLAKKYEILRKGKEDFNQAIENMKHAEFVSAMLINTKDVDCAIGGVHLATSSILKAAFKAIGPVEGIKTISSVMVMAKEDKTYLFADISVNPTPDAIQLADIAQNANSFAKDFNLEEKVAFLSFSTAGSAKTEETAQIAEATKIFNSRTCSKYPAIGEIQFDAAFVENVKKQKYNLKNNFDGTATTFIFPDLNAGNIGYKIAQRMGNWSAMGPIITGLKKPFNDLSRGSTIQNVIDSAIVTARQALAIKEKINNG